MRDSHQTVRAVLPWLGGLVLLALASQSCTTMQAYESRRQAQVAQAKKTQAPAPTLNDKPKLTPGSLLNPAIAPPVVDEASQRANQSAQQAQAQADQNAPDKLRAPASGPLLPNLKTTLTSLDDLRATLVSYESFTRSVEALRISLEAYSLQSNLTGLQRLRAAVAWWKTYFQVLAIYPDGDYPRPLDVKAFFAAIQSFEARSSREISRINELVDKARTRPYGLVSGG